MRSSNTVPPLPDPAASRRLNNWAFHATGQLLLGRRTLPQIAVSAVIPVLLSAAQLRSQLFWARHPQYAATIETFKNTVDPVRPDCYRNVLTGDRVLFQGTGNPNPGTVREVFCLDADAAQTWQAVSEHGGEQSVVVTRFAFTARSAIHWSVLACRLQLDADGWAELVEMTPARGSLLTAVRVRRSGAGYAGPQDLQLLLEQLQDCRLVHCEEPAAGSDD